MMVLRPRQGCLIRGALKTSLRCPFFLNTISDCFSHPALKIFFSEQTLSSVQATILFAHETICKNIVAFFIL